MTTQNAKGIQAGYRKVGILLFVGLASIGFTRLEDRAIIGVPGALANGIAARAVTDDAGPAEDYTQAPDDSVSMGNMARTPTNRIRRVLQDREVPNVASRQIVTPSGQRSENVAGIQPDPATGQGVVQELASIASASPAFASLAPPLGGQGSPVFAASIPNNGAGGGSGGGGGGGGNGGVTPPPPPPPGPVTPIPEPGTWLLIIMGLFAVGGALRSRTPRSAESTVAKVN
jgi:hypothetical protein